ncbi:MAG: hypothetical protein D6805_10140 [Planctomycetota bacterium]|nr:MAG: hypothetical protein D6805_10140 [Planctomycetota bacterium]
MVGGRLCSKRVPPTSQKFLEVRNLSSKKVPRRKVFGKSENLFSKRFSGGKVLEKGFLVEKFFP